MCECPIENRAVRPSGLHSVVVMRSGGACLPAATVASAALTAPTTEMAEGELDVDSLISRLLEGEFIGKFIMYSSFNLSLVMNGFVVPVTALL